MSPQRALLIDAGNSRIKWACWAVPESANSATGMPPVWQVRGDLPTADPSLLQGQLAQALATSGAGWDVAVLCSVAGDGVDDAIAAALEAVCAVESSSSAVSAMLQRFRAQAQVGPLRNDYEQPARLGADRLAAALGAWARVQGPALVVCAGTATTVDVLQVGTGADLAPRFSGGIIFPGLDLMRRALATQTARLPDASGVYQALPRNTDDAITSGCLNAQIGAIERMRAQLPVGAPCLLAGGAAERLRPWVAAPVVYAPDLVLEGLAAAILHGFQTSIKGRLLHGTDSHPA